jgi:hypothetical protein
MPSHRCKIARSLFFSKRDIHIYIRWPPYILANFFMSTLSTFEGLLMLEDFILEIVS